MGSLPNTRRLDAVILRYEQEIDQENVARLKVVWKENHPDVRCTVLDRCAEMVLLQDAPDTITVKCHSCGSIVIIDERHAAKHEEHDDVIADIVQPPDVVRGDDAEWSEDDDGNIQ